MAVTIVYGPPCAGKTTYVRENRGPGEPVVDFDALAVAFGAPDRDDVSGSIIQCALAAKSAAVARILDLDAIDTAWIIYTSPSREALAGFEKDGAVVVRLDPGEMVCKERALEAGRPQAVITAIENWYSRDQDNTKGADVKTKQMTMSIKSAGGESEGLFTGYAAVFGNRDRHGDIVVKGAFEETLKSYGVDGAGIPCYWAHNLNDPEMNIGSTVKAFEDEHGLRVDVQLDMSNPKAVYVDRLIKSGRVGTMSFTFEVVEGGWSDGDKDAYLITKVNLFEVSVVAVPANAEAAIIAAKQAWETVAPASGPEIEEQLAEVERELTGDGGEDPGAGKAQAVEDGDAEDLVEGKSWRDPVILTQALLAVATAHHDMSEQ